MMAPLGAIIKSMREYFKAQLDNGESDLTYMLRREDGSLTFQYIDATDIDTMTVMVFESMWFGDDTIPVFKNA